MSNDPYREWAAGYVLGALDPTERAEFDDHLDGCAECRAAVMDFAPLPGLLATVDEGELRAAAPDGADAVVAAAAAAHRRTERSRRRWRTAAGGLAAAAILFFVVAFAQWSSDADDGPAFPGQPVELAVASDTDATGSIVMRGQDWGTFLLVDLVDLPARDEYTLWVVADDGREEVAGRWAYAESGTCRVPGSTGFAVDSIVRVVVTSATDQADELVWARGR